MGAGFMESLDTMWHDMGHIRGANGIYRQHSLGTTPTDQGVVFGCVSGCRWNRAWSRRDMDARSMESLDAMIQRICGQDLPASWGRGAAQHHTSASVLTDPRLGD